MRDVRKVVTVLFCDLAGYTSTGDQLDPEALRAIQSRYFEDARAALERHGGTVEKFIGDAVMAVFGIPTLHEDDALRALRAATELRDAVAGLGFQARIGVNTGEVVAGGGDALVTGDAVNVAARLEQAAEPGQILLGERTRVLARDAIEVEPVDPVEAKGKPEPVPAFRLLGVTEGAEAIARQLDAPLVGRTEELAFARNAFTDAVKDRRCRLLTVLGPPGIGKSRLAREFARAVGTDAEVLFGRCLPYGEGITYWPFVEIFRAAGAEDELAAALAAGAPEDIFWAVRKALERRAAQRPVVLGLEDIHWAEPTLLDLIEHVAEWSRDAPILLLCLARPEFLEARPAWGSAQLRLEPLSADETDELIAELLAGTSLDESARVRITATSEGNPLYVEQLMAMLAEGGDPEHIPATIHALLAARLDALPTSQRELLERAAVVGLEFEWDALAELDADRRRPPGAELAALVRKELIRPHDLIGDTFRFRHLLIRDAAYERIPKQLRVELHERCAVWLDGRGEEFDEIVGYHLEQAHHSLVQLGQPGNRSFDLAEKAGERLGTAGKRAFARSDMPAAQNLLERAVALLPENDTRGLKLQPSLGRAHMEMGQWERSESVLTQAVEDARKGGDRAVGADAAVALAYVRLHLRGQSHAEVQRELDESIRVFEELGDTAGLARSLSVVANLRYWQGETAVSAEYSERAASYARMAGDRAHEVESIRWLALAITWGPTPVDEAVERLGAIRVEHAGNRPVDADVMRFLGQLEAMKGHFDAARELIAQARLAAEDLGLAVRIAAGIPLIAGYIELLARDGKAAERVLAPGCEALERMGDWGHFTSIAPRLADALWLQGRDDEALRLTEATERHAIEDDVDPQILWRRVRAKVLARSGDLSTAECLAREAVEIAGRTDLLDDRGHTNFDLGKVLRIAGRPAEATAALDEAIRLYEQKGNVVGVRNARVALDELAAQPPATA